MIERLLLLRPGDPACDPNEAGQDMIEYALLLGFIAVVTVLVITNMGQSVSTVLSTAAAAIP